MNKIDLEKEAHIVEELYEFCKKSSPTVRNSYAIVVRNKEGELEIHTRHQRPCYGEMRNYKEKSKNRPEDRFPSDLINNFPDGTPVAVALVFSKTNEEVEKIRGFCFSESNPWLGKNKEFYENLVWFYQDDRQVGVLINSGDLPPTYLVASFMLQRHFSKLNHDMYLYFKDNGVDEKTSRIISMITNVYNTTINMHGSSVLSSGSNLFKILNQTPKDLDNGMLWSERCDYNRPEIMLGFADADNPLHFMSYTPKENFLRKFNLGKFNTNKVT